ncbi:MAG: hypothetical protein NVS4B8_04880 [Herpetosiphon sp.]
MTSTLGIPTRVVADRLASTNSESAVVGDVCSCPDEPHNAATIGPTIAV